MFTGRNDEVDGSEKPAVTVAMGDAGQGKMFSQEESSQVRSVWR
jgi:hypothetical protein